MATFKPDEVRAHLRDLPGWQLEGNAIRKQYRFRGFRDAVGFVNRVAEAAERADHHPDILVQYNRVTLTLSTHSEGGVTQKDLDLARQLDTLTGTEHAQL